MSIIAATPDYVFTLESGVIYRHKADEPAQRSPMDTPANAAHIMATSGHLYVLDSSGNAYRRWHESTTWSEFDVPADTTFLSSSPTTVFALADAIYRRHDTLLESFSLAVELTLSDVIQLDHDEGYSYALTSDGTIYYAEDDSGSWIQYPEPLDDVVEIAAGVDYVYARNSDGEVYRSKHIGFSGWAMMGNYADVLGIAIDTGHRDRLWLHRAAGVTYQSSADWIGRITNTAPLSAWITAAWIDSDWIRVA